MLYFNPPLLLSAMVGANLVVCGQIALEFCLVRSTTSTSKDASEAAMLSRACVSVVQSPVIALVALNFTPGCFSLSRIQTQGLAAPFFYSKDL